MLVDKSIFVLTNLSSEYDSTTSRYNLGMWACNMLGLDYPYPYHRNDIDTVPLDPLQ